MKTKRSVVDMLMMRLLNAHWAHLQTSEGHAIVLRVFPDFGYRLIDKLGEFGFQIPRGMLRPSIWFQLSTILFRSN